MPTPKTIKGEFIEITARKCGSLQPHISVGSRWQVEAVGKTSSGDDVLTCPYAKSKRRSVRINSSRFSWRVLCRRDIQEQECRRRTDEITRSFSREEQIQIAILPLIYAHLAWMYGARAVDMAISYRLDFLKKITRQVRESCRAYERLVARDLDGIHTRTITDAAERFLALNEKDFTVMYFTLSNLYAKRFPDYPYRDLRCTALMSMMLISLYDGQYRLIDDMVEQRLGHCRRKARNPLLSALYTCMEAIVGDLRGIDLEDPNLVMCRKIISNRLNEAQITVS